MAKINFCANCRVLPERKWDVLSNGTSVFALSCPKCKTTAGMFESFDAAINSWNEMMAQKKPEEPKKYVRGKNTKVICGHVYKRMGSEDIHKNGCIYCGDAFIHGRNVFWCPHDDFPYAELWKDRRFEDWYREHYPTEGDGFYVGEFGDYWFGDLEQEPIDDDYTEDTDVDDDEDFPSDEVDE